MLKLLIKERLVRVMQKDIERICQEQTDELDKKVGGITTLSEVNRDLQRRILALEENARNNNNLICKLQAQIPGALDPYEVIDYGTFENHFRGSRELILERQKEYLTYFAGKKCVVDLGCGRGEFLELMKQNEIPAVGVDLYQPFVEECISMGFDVWHQDAIEYLRNCDPVDGIFASQLAEHLQIVQLLELCRLAYQKLKDGGCLILETPNPMSLSIFTHSFYIDPSHNKPVHPLTLQYYLQLAGFEKTEILYTENSKFPVRIPALTGDQVENLEAFNDSMKEVNNYLFGSMDYAIIATKKGDCQ